jgi:hypothetical protein
MKRKMQKDRLRNSMGAVCRGVQKVTLMRDSIKPQGREWFTVAGGSQCSRQGVVFELLAGECNHHKRREVPGKGRPQEGGDVGGAG